MNRTAPAQTGLATALAFALALMPAHARPLPAGFEDLVVGHTERLEVRLFGRSAGLWPVRVGLDSVTVEQPAQVLAALPLGEDARMALLPALSAPMPRNSHLACRFGLPEAGCGWLDPPDDPGRVRVIHDEGEGALLLFPARQWLPAESAAPSRYHQPSEHAENALLHQQTLNFSGGDGYQSLSAQGGGVLGIGRHGHLSVDWSFNRQVARAQRSRQHFQFDDAYYRHDLAQQHYLQLGRMDRRNLSSPQGGAFGFSLLPLDRFEGLRLGTTQAYVDTDASVDATPLTVLLGRNARVDAFDGDRLLQTFYLQAGVNDIDTRRFPFGSYTVTLRIYEDGVLVRSEETPFSKGGDWADASAQWFVQGGRRRERSHHAADGSAVMQAGLRVPLLRDVGLVAGMARAGGSGYGELRLEAHRRIGEHDLRVQLAALRGSDGSHGDQQQLGYQFQRTSWNVYRHRLRGAACQAAEIDFDRLGCTDALSVSMAMPLAGGNLHLGHTRRRSYRPHWELGGIEDDPQTGLPPGLQPIAPVLRPAQQSRSVQASYGRSMHWRGLMLSSRLGLWQQRSDSNDVARRDRGIYLNLSVSRLQRHAGGSVQQRAGFDLRQPRHQRPDASTYLGGSWRQEHDGGSRELSAELRARNQDRYAGQLGARVHNRLGQSSAALSRYQQAGRSEMSYSASHTSGFALNGSGLYWGGALGAEAGLAVRVDRADELDLRGAAAELQVAGHRRQTVRFGERRLLPLGGYQRHRAEVRDAGALDTDIAVRVARQGAAQSLFLAPGRLMTLPIALDVTWTFIGTARDSGGASLQGARILNAPVPTLGRDGSFIAEFAQRETTLYLLQDERLLQCPLQVRERRSVLLMVGIVACEPLAVEQLPAGVRQQARVQRLLREQHLLAAGEQGAVAGGGR